MARGARLLRPVRRGAIHLLRAVRPRLVAAATRQPRAARASPCRCRRVGRSSADAPSPVAIDLCKNDPVRAAMRAAPRPASSSAVGARPRLRIACGACFGTWAAFQSKIPSSRRSRSMTLWAAVWSMRSVPSAWQQGRVYVADPRGALDLELSAGRRTKRAVARPRTVAGRIRLMNVLFVRLARVGALLALCVVMLGAWVRLTDAGLGCPDWPGCYGRLVVPDAATAARRARQRVHAPARGRQGVARDDPSLSREHARPHLRRARGDRVAQSPRSRTADASTARARRPRRFFRACSACGP